MNKKLSGSHLAVGAWSNPWKRTNAEQMASKIRVLLQDKLITRGRFVDLYVPVSSNTAGVVQCSCVKETNSTADKTCLSCHGTRYAPGFLKFLTETIFFDVAENANFTLSNTELYTGHKPNQIVLSSGQTSGTVETSDKSFTNPNDLDWDLRMQAFNRASGNSISIEFSTDSGMSWSPIITLNKAGSSDILGSISGASLSGSGNIRFRITLSRANATDLSPTFQIVRVRRLRTEDENSYITKARTDHVNGQILILRPWIQEQDSVDPMRGRLIDHIGDRTWTAPLDFFDTSITKDSTSTRVDDTLGLHSFYRYTAGVQPQTNYVITKVSISDQLGTFTHQYFDDRRAQDGEAYSLVW